MSVNPSPHPRLWTVLRKMHLKTDLKPAKSAAARQRPDTATLDKPLILDAGLLRKVDMTRLTRDRLLTIENLITTPKKSRVSPKLKEKPAKTIPRTKSREEKLEVSDNGSLEELTPRKHSRILNTTFRVRSHVRKGLKEVFSSSQQLPSHLEKPEPAKNKTPQIKEANPNRDKKSVEDVFGTLILSEHEVPSPCSTCGRSEKPERLHAHPSMPQNKRSRLKDDQENTAVVPQKNSVTKPVAMKFRSGKLKADKVQDGERALRETQVIELKSPSLVQEQRKTVPLIRKETFKIERNLKSVVEKKTSLNSPSPTRKFSYTVTGPVRRQALPRTPERRLTRVVTPEPSAIPVPAPLVHSASPRRPRTVTCYLCHKQFGTASYHLHEPQCLQKWHRENEALPAGQQQAQPQRPADGQDLWEHAWEAAQAVMLPCEGCSKTFLPHRLEAHLRVCPQAPLASPARKLPSRLTTPKQLLQVQAQPQPQDSESDRSERSVLLEGPTSVHCHICGRVFNKLAIDKHEQHCLKRWQLEHSRDSSSSPQSGASTPSTAPSTPRRRLVLCYLCGRQFGSASIAIHEPQCLRKWRQENERLPPSQRRQEPRKPDQVIDPVTGEVDERLTAEAQWQSHLVQLVPCGRCGRTFNPDRVVVHEKCCKGKN